MTRQRLAQLAHRLEGRCELCGRPPFLTGVLCYQHCLRRRLNSRRRVGAQPWHPGGPGRPPVEAR